MIGNTIRRIIIALIFILPVVSYTGCKKQAKCGCGKDVLYTLTGSSAYIYWGTGATISFQIVGDPYSTYTVCNPSEVLTKLTDAKSGDILQVSGHVYWDCNYVYQQSNSSYSYSSYYKVYNVQVTDMFLDLYGKGKTAPAAQMNPIKNND